MQEPLNEKVQWSMLVRVLHGPNYGHRIAIETKSRGRDIYEYSGGAWRGLGIPADVLQSVLASIDSIVGDHLVTRYGVANELPLKWSGEPDTF